MGRSNLTPGTLRALENVAWAPDTDGVWWHDIPYPERAALLRRGLIREIYNPGCGTHGHSHPGYMTASREGLLVLGLVPSPGEDFSDEVKDSSRMNVPAYFVPNLYRNGFRSFYEHPHPVGALGYDRVNCAG